MCRRGLAVFVIAMLLMPMTPAAASAMPEAPNCPIYPDNDVWHSSIQNLPVHPMSASWLANMGGPSRLLHPDFGGPYGYQLQVVDNTTPTRRVSFDYADESDDVGYPFTAGTPIEPASDAHAFMLNKDTCVLYELFAASWNGGNPTAGSGAVFDLKTHALRPSGWTSADAAGLPILPGLVRYDEVAAGAIAHALRFTTNHTRTSYIYPARHQAGESSSTSLPPMGLRVRLKAGYDTSRLSPQARVIAEALKHYGMILADNGSPWYITGTSDPQFNDDVLHELDVITGRDLEVVDTTALVNGP